jgi:hypothetical protein
MPEKPAPDGIVARDTKVVPKAIEVGPGHGG